MTHAKVAAVGLLWQIAIPVLVLRKVLLPNIYIYYCVYIYIYIYKLCIYIYTYICIYIYVYIWTPEMGLEGVFLSSLEQPGRNAKTKHTFQGHRSSFRWINPRLRRSRLMHGHFHAVETCRRQFVIGWVGMCQRLIIWWLSPTLW